MIQPKSLGFLLIGFSVILLFIITFVKIDVDKQAAFLCEKFHENQLDMQQCPAHKSNTSWLLASAFGISFLILGAGIFILIAYKSAAEGLKRRFKDIGSLKLDGEEKKIYMIVRNKEGSVYQTDLIKETEYSKVKITRILDKLEAKGIVERKRRGMTNIVVLR